MTEIALTEDEKQELMRLRAEKQPLLMVAFRQTPSRSREALLELELIKPYAQEIIAQSMGEQEWGELHRSVMLGIADLFIVFSVNNEDDKKILETQGDTKDKEFVGYIYVTYPSGGTVAHILHLYILEKYRAQSFHSSINKFHDEFMEILRSRGVKHVGMSTKRDGFLYDAKKLGWTETYLNYRMKL